MCVNASKWADTMVSYVIGIHWNVVDICKYQIQNKWKLHVLGTSSTFTNFNIIAIQKNLICFQKIWIVTQPLAICFSEAFHLACLFIYLFIYLSFDQVS
jgi:hypothetical protein